MARISKSQREIEKETFGNRDWRLNNLYYIRNKAGKKVRFIRNATQNVLHASKSKLNMTLKGRQQGVSTYYLIDRLDKAMYTPNYSAGILSHDLKSIEKLFRVVRMAYENMPVSDDYRPVLGRGGGSKYKFEFPEINSMIFVDLEIRSESINSLHVSEYGLMKNKDRFNASIEAVPSDGEISIESTPMGMNHFYNDWFDPSFPYKKHFFPWFFHHENKMPFEGDMNFSDDEIELVQMAKENYNIDLTLEQIAWRRFKIGQRGEKGLADFLQEHPEDDIGCFLSSGDSVMDNNFLSKLSEEAKKPIRKNGDITYWHSFERGVEYVMGVDCAEGIGGDYSVATLLNKETREEVAQIRGHIKPKKFAEMILGLAEEYSWDRGSPLIAVERNNHGHAVLLWLEHEMYPNLYTHRDNKIGWHTNSVTRPIMVDRLINAIESREIKLNSHATIKECMTLVNEKGKIQAMEKKHDDCFISVAIGLEMCVNNVSAIESLVAW